MENSRIRKLFAPIAAAGLACALAATVAVPGAAVQAKQGAAEEETQQQTTVQTVKLERLYNPYSGEHFFTTNDEEVLNLTALGWTDEGESWTAPAEGDEVYRLYNPYSSDHHFTMSTEERDTLKNLGWTDEGVAFHSANASTGVKIFRWYNPYVAIGTHLYTGSEAENSAVAQAGWEEEGVGFYGVKTTTPSTTTYTVTFNMNGHGDAIDPVKVNEGDKVAAPTAPTADGYTFTGWFSDEKCTTEFDFTTTAIEKDTTVYAGWKQLTYTISSGMRNTVKSLNPKTLKFVTGNDSALEGLSSIAEVQADGSGKIGVFKDGDTVYIAPMAENSASPSKTDSVIRTEKSCFQFFYMMSTLESLDLSNLDTSNATYMQNMFNSDVNLKSIEFGSHFDTATVTSMEAMFADCSSLNTLTLPSDFNASCVESTYAMFSGCSSLTSVNLSSSLDITQVTDARSMFSDCSSLELDCSNWLVNDSAEHDGFNKNAPKVDLPSRWSE